MVGWVDLDPGGPSSRNRSAYHWACVVRREGDPRWIPTPGSGTEQAWTRDDDHRGDALKDAILEHSPKWRELAAVQAKQRLEPLLPHLKGIKHLVVLNSPALAGVPIEAMFEAQRAKARRGRRPVMPRRGRCPRGCRDPGRVPPATPRLLALGDPAYSRPEPATSSAMPPDHGIAVQKVAPNG